MLWIYFFFSIRLYLVKKIKTTINFDYSFSPQFLQALLVLFFFVFEFFLQKCFQHRSFCGKSLRHCISKDNFILHWSGNSDKYDIIDSNLFSLNILKVLLHCLLEFNVAVEKSDVNVIVVLLYLISPEYYSSDNIIDLSFNLVFTFSVLFSTLDETYSVGSVPLYFFLLW